MLTHSKFRSLPFAQRSPAHVASVPRCSGLEAFEATAFEHASSSTEDDQHLAALITFSLPQALAQQLPPYLRNLYDEAVRIQRLIRLGKLMQAWIDMPRLVRLAQLDRSACPLTLSVFKAPSHSSSGP
jgi:hypothetical protein